MPEEGAVRGNPQECSPGTPSRLRAEQLTLYRPNSLQAKSQPSGGAEQTLAQQNMGGNVLEEEHR